MENGIRTEIQNRLRVERAWIKNDRVKLLADRHEIEARKNDLVSWIEHIGIPPTDEMNLDKLEADHRNALQHCFQYFELVTATDASTGKTVIGRIDHAIRSKRLGPGIDPDWVLIKGTWYRDKEVSVERTKEIDDYSSSDLESDCGAKSPEDQFAVDDIVRLTDPATGNTTTPQTNLGYGDYGSSESESSC